MRVFSINERINKYRKRKILILVISLIIVGVLLSMSIGYAYLSNQLSIYGTAYISGYILEEGVLPSNPIKDGDNYVSGSNPPNGGTIQEDYWEGNTYNLTLGVPGTIGFVTTYTYMVKVQNDTNLPWTDGKTTSEIISAGGGWFGKALQQFDTAISQTTVNSGEILTVTFTVKYRSNLDCSASSKATVTFNFNGEERQLIFNINFKMT